MSVQLAQLRLDVEQQDGRVPGRAPGQLIEQGGGAGGFVSRAVHHRLLVETRGQQPADVGRVAAAQTGTAGERID